MAEQQQTPANTPGPTDTTQTGAARFAYKQCPTFDPTFYRAWASEVALAFAEREWSNYLTPPDGDSDDESEFIPDPKIALKARAFLSQTIGLVVDDLVGCSRISGEILEVDCLVVENFI